MGGTLKQAVDSEHLDWSGTGLDSDDAKVVAHVVAVSGSLMTLLLNGNKIGDAGAVAIADALRVNGSLDTLDLSNNKLGDAGAVAIADALADADALAGGGLLYFRAGKRNHIIANEP